MPKVAKSRSTEMGAIDEAALVRRQRLKSISIETSGDVLAQNSGHRSASTQLDFDGPLMTAMRVSRTFDQDDDDDDEDFDNSDAQTDVTVSDSRSTNSNFLSISPGPLKPSASTSFLFGADEPSDKDKDADSSVTVPTKASLTHEWKKLKTPNKCRECNLLVYFNGRECSFCGFVAHKRCVTVLVIKCSGQKVSEMLSKRQDNGRGLKSLKTLVNADPNSPQVQSQQQQQQQQHQQQQQQHQPQPQPQSRKTKTTIMPIFGQPILVDSFQVVDFIRRFIYEIETRGLTSKGIYRVSSIKSKVDRLCNYYDQNLSSLVDLSSFHPNIIANALKMYLRQLPEPLLTRNLYNSFIEVAKKYPQASPSSLRRQQPSMGNAEAANRAACNSPSLDSPTQDLLMSRRLSAVSLGTMSTCSSEDQDPMSYDPMMIADLQEIVDLLPPINRELVAIIMRHLRRVSEMSRENQMSATNLSIIFGPTLLSASDGTLAIVDNVHQARAVEIMIKWANQIFPQYASYESKAVIELCVPEVVSEYEIQNRLVSCDQHKKSNKQQSNSDNKESDTIAKQDRASKEKSCEWNRANEEPGRGGQEKEDDDADSCSDMGELRRQFITVPAKKTNKVVNNVIHEILAGKTLNPPKSEPVVKAQPLFCKILSKGLKLR